LGRAKIYVLKPVSKNLVFCSVSLFIVFLCVILLKVPGQAISNFHCYFKRSF